MSVRGQKDANGVSGQPASRPLILPLVVSSVGTDRLLG
jgi:hypothetical protein